MIHGGEATNVIPESARCSGTVRTFTIDVTDAGRKADEADRRD